MGEQTAMHISEIDSPKLDGFIRATRYKKSIVRRNIKSEHGQRVSE